MSDYEEAQVKYELESDSSNHHQPDPPPSSPSGDNPQEEDDENLPKTPTSYLDARQSLRFFMMKAQNASSVPELSNSEIKKLLMSPPQSPSINSTSKEAASATSAPRVTETEDKEEESDSDDALVMALPGEVTGHRSSAGAGSVLNSSSGSSKRSNESTECISTTTSTTTLKTLSSPLNDGVYTYWAVVKTQNTGPSGISTGSSNYLAKINFGR